MYIFKDIPVELIFYWFPFVSIFARLLGLGQLNYDFFWVPVFALTLFLSYGVRLRWKYILLVLIVGGLILLKYGLPLIFEKRVQFHPWMMDLKWVAYFIFAILWIGNYGWPSQRIIYKGSLFFSKLYIIWTLYIIASGQLSREGILMESNYDGFMILMGLCWIDKCKEGRYDGLIFIIATFLTFSRTGFISLSVLLLYRVTRRNILYLLPVITVALIIAYFALMVRGMDSAGNMDRFVFFSQTYVYFAHTSIWNVLFGSAPGVSLDMPVVSGFEYFISNFEEGHGINGIYPFYFHSTYLRLAMTWGVIGSLAYLLFFVYKFLTSKLMPMKMFCLLVLVQSISLSTMTLQNVSILFFMMLFTLISIENKRDRLISILMR